MDTLIAGKSTFKLQVPYKLIRSGEQGKKPLIVYFHGYGEDITEMEEKIEPLLSLDAYHLFIQGPYALQLNPKEKNRKGFSYYQYDSEDTYINSIEFTSEFIQEIIDHIIPIVEVSRITLVGYSMGAYLAGYWAFTRWKHANDLLMINGRLKTEWFKSKIEDQDVLNHIQIVAFNGNSDTIVDPETQREMINYCKEHKLNAQYHELNGGHELTNEHLIQIKDWLLSLGYRNVVI